MGKRTYVDLFSGCGGLSLGLEKAGFELALAVEKSPMAAETFFHNLVEPLRDKKDWSDFCHMPVDHQAKKGLIVNDIQSLLSNGALIRKLRKQDIDIIAGGPPCQGFSMTGRRNPRDVRNRLAWQFLDVVQELGPKAVLIENVIGINQDFVKQGKSAPFQQIKTALENINSGYKVQPVLLNAMHFGVPQHRPRVMLIGIRSDLAHDIKFSSSIWNSVRDQESQFISERPDIVPVATYFDSAIRTVKDAIGDLNDHGYRFKSEADFYSKEIGIYANVMRNDRAWMRSSRKGFSPNNLFNHTLRKHTEEIVTRFRLHQVLGQYEISSKVLNLSEDNNRRVVRKFLNPILSEVSQGAFYAPDKTAMANSKEELLSLIMRFGTKKYRQKMLRWDAPSPTIVCAPDDHIHPTSPRTFSVRELARFQSFPDSFVFRSKETTGGLRRRFEVPQFSQVGNAVPPMLAEAIGSVILGVLENSVSKKMSRLRSS